ncbi:transcriptional repressor LexA [Aerococcaceae bacterium DSM 111020]|nr:transcriptional repressor LexA [Aerococcaceae bacterium DSM 111020]
MKSLTNKQYAIVECIYQAIQSNGYPPTVREIGSQVGLASTSTVHGHLSRLEKAGYIIKDPSKTRALELTDLALQALDIQPKQIPMLGRVAAGAPILAVEDASDFYPIPSHLNHFDANDLFMLEISGESMINIGIMDGDIITVRRQPSVENGEVVVAMTEDDEATCKTFFKKSDHYVLRPENDSMEDIIVDHVTILGKVVSLFREF